MGEHRKHQRVDYEETCMLKLRGMYYPTTVKNISFGGALVHFYNPQLVLHVGDDCAVCMNGVSLHDYPCKIARIEASDIAVKFTGRHIFKAVGQ
jgi:hypothetical protein